MKKDVKNNSNQTQAFNLDLHKDKVIGEARRLNTPIGINQKSETTKDEFELDFVYDERNNTK